MTFTRKWAALAAGAALFQAQVVEAQPQCLTEQEVSAIAIYSVPGMIQAVRLKCGASLSPSGYLANGGDQLSAKYTGLQRLVWPQARSGLVKILASNPDSQGVDLGPIAELPDEAVRPLIDALIVQETAPRIAVGNCATIERMLQMMAPIDPQAAGTVMGLLGGMAGFVDIDRFPICANRRS